MSEDKKTYYVAVGAGEITQGQGDFSYEFEIEATDEEIERLYDLFGDKENADDASFIRSHIPFEEYHNDQANDEHDRALTEIYHMLHELGTPETRDHIKSMHVLDRFPEMAGSSETPLG